MKVSPKSLNRLPLTRRLQLTILVISCVAFGYAITVHSSTPAPGAVADNEPAPMFQDKDYSKFTHTNAFHSRLPCLLCHRRDDNSPRIRFPGQQNHLPCAGCHALQFSDNSSPICTICHTNAQTGAMKGFPSLRSFSARFDHARHVRQTNCATCHKQTNRGVGFSIPSRATAHATCFQCHTANRPIGSCNTCHSPGRVARTSEWAKAFTENFSHQKHIVGGHMSCSTCHTVRPGTARGRQVSAPLASMHFAPARTTSCGGCHNGERAFGPNDFTNCKRCHQNKTFRF